MKFTSIPPEGMLLKESSMRKNFDAVMMIGYGAPEKKRGHNAFSQKRGERETDT